MQEDVAVLVLVVHFKTELEWMSRLRHASELVVRSTADHRTSFAASESFLEFVLDRYDALPGITIFVNGFRTGSARAAFMARDGYESRHTPETVLNSLSTSDADFGAIRALAPFARYGDDDEITACAVAVAAELTLDGDVDYEAAPHFFVSRARLRSVPRAVYARLLAQLRAAMSIPGTESAFETLIAMLLAQEPPTQREVEVPETPNPTYKRRARALYRRAPVMGMAFSFR